MGIEQLIEKAQKVKVEKREAEIRREVVEAKAKAEVEERERFEKTKAEMAEGKELIDSYGSVKIYRVRGEPLPIYTIPVIKPAGPERNIINTVREAATRLITISPSEIRDPEERRRFYFKRVKEIIEASPELGVPPARIDFYADMVVKEMIGYGILDPLVQDDQLEEIMVIGPQKSVYVFHRRHGMLKTNVVFANDDEIQYLIQRIAAQVNRRVDMQNPLLDARLPDGSRVNATLMPISLGGSTLTIRKFTKDPFTIVDLMRFGTLDANLAAFLWLAVDGMGVKPANILIAGGTGSGKTTTLNVLAEFIPARERIITIEDTAEVALPHEHWIRFEARPPGLERTGEISMDILVKNSLRMRPDRIIVGEIRHAEAFTLFTAINTGHQGCMGTVHANSAEETLIRLMNPPMNVPPIMIKALDFIIMQQRIHDPRRGTIRRITEVAEVTGVFDSKPEIQIIFQWDPVSDEIRPTGNPSRYIAELCRFTGLSEKQIAEEIKRRREILVKLFASGKRSMADVVAAVRAYSEGHG